MQPELTGVPIFAGMTDEALELLLTRKQETAHSSGEVILHEGEPGNRFFLIIEGSVRVCKHHGTPHEIELAILNTRDFFGEMCVLETLPRSATVTAVQPTKLLSLPSVAFYHLYNKLPAQYSILVLNIARDLSRRLRHLDDVFAARH